MELRWTEEAASDLERITDYLFQNAPERAAELVREIYNAPAALLAFPYRGRAGKKARSADLLFRSAAFCCQLGTNRRPPKQVCATRFRISWSTKSPARSFTLYASCTARRSGLKESAAVPPGGAHIVVHLCARPSASSQPEGYLDARAYIIVIYMFDGRIPRRTCALLWLRLGCR